MIIQQQVQMPTFPPNFCQILSCFSSVIFNETQKSFMKYMNPSGPYCQSFKRSNLLACIISVSFSLSLQFPSKSNGLIYKNISFKMLQSILSFFIIIGQKFRRKYTDKMPATHQTNHRDNSFLRMRGRLTGNPTLVVE